MVTVPTARFRVLGVVEALVGERAVDIGHARQRAVLAVLLTEANRVVTHDQVIDRVWGQARTPDNPRGAVRTYVWLLRRALAAAHGVEIVRQSSGYKAVLDEQCVDLHRFRELIAQARAAGEDGRAAELLGQALALWRGEPFTGLDTPWSDALRQNLQLQRHSARLDLTDLQLRLGRHAALLGELTDEAEEHMLDERIAGQLMLSLYRCGRQADALACYRRIRERLAHELGSDPGPALHRLHQQILTADPALALPVPDPPPGRARAAPTPRQLPAAPRLFTGRRHELDQLAKTLVKQTAPDAAVMIAAVDGMAGTGKTALALRAAHLLAEHFPDGQLFIDLHAYAEGLAPREPADALAVLLHGLGVAPSAIPPDLDARAAAYRDRLAGTRTLIVLDNAADEAQVRPLLPGAGGSAVLITSRRRLKALDDAVPLPLGVLPLGEAVALLRQVARVPGVPDEPGDDARWEQGAELCGRLPLALMIGGALLRSGGKAWTLTRLIDRLTPRRAGDELAGYTDDSRSLAAMFDLSYQALPERERRLFRRLGQLSGPEIDAYSAAALLQTGPATADVLIDRLADHNMLISSAPGRYRVHDLTRAYARTLAAKLDPEPERAAAQGRLLHYYAHTAQSASRPIARRPRAEPDGPVPAHAPDLAHPDAARAWLRAEHQNLDAAFSHAHTRGLGEFMIPLAAGLAEILRVDGPWTRALDVHSAAVRTAERAGRVADHAAALTDLGDVRYLTADIAGAVDDHTRALELSRGIDDRFGEATALHGLGRVRRLSGDYPGASEAHTRALRIYDEIDERFGVAIALHDLGHVRYLTGDYPAAVEAFTRALELYREIGDRFGEAVVLFDSGRVRQTTGDHLGAADALSRALEIFRALGSSNGEANVLNDLGDVRCAVGDYPAAVQAHTMALEIYHRLDNRHGEASALTKLGRALQGAGDCAGAVDALARALGIFRELGSRGDEAWALNYYAAALAATGERPHALALYRQALALHRELNKPDDEAVALEGIGEHHLATADPVRAAEHLQQSFELFQRLGMRTDADRVQARLHALAAQGTRP